MIYRFILPILPLVLSCGGKDGEDGDSANDACTTAAETMANVSDCTASQDDLKMQCEEFREIGSLTNCTGEFDSWLQCSTEWLAFEPDGVGLDCTDGMVSFGYDPEEVTNPCEELNEAFWTCTGLGDSG